MTNPTLSPKDVAELREFVVYIRDKNDLYIKHSGATGKYLTVAEREKVDALLALASQSLEREGALRRIKNNIDSQLNDYLSNMEEGFDDSVVGFNEAWDIVRKIFKEEDARALAQQPPAGEKK